MGDGRQQWEQMRWAQNDQNLESIDLKSRNLGTVLILLAPVILVAAPVLWKGTRSEIAHWYLAAAANALELGKGNGESALAKAQAWDPEVSKLQDYWTVRILQIENDSNASLSDVLKDVPAERARDVSSKLARTLARRGKFKQASAAYQELLGDKALKEIFYWDLMISDAYLDSGASHAVALLREAIELNPTDDIMRAGLAEQYARIFTRDEEFDAALDAFKLLFGDDFVRDANSLNTLAYARATALRELDEALVDINEALTYAPQDPSLRDTRGWVLYQLGKYEEALADADFAVKELEKPTLMNWLNSRAAEAASAAPNSSPTATRGLKEPHAGEIAQDPASIDTTKNNDQSGEASTASPLSTGTEEKSYLTESTADPTIWTRGVIRYHRAKILEKLGRSDEARADWDYLESNRLPPDDRLH